MKAYVKQFDPRAEQFLAQGHNLSKLGRGPLGEATYWKVMI